MKQIKGHKEGQQGQGESQACEKGDRNVMDQGILQLLGPSLEAVFPDRRR